ncbi:MAG: class I SAM-dependent methyltransferase [Candidatus Latescibacterota bacterium]|nr:MAG: class I SAM-dependent methyltransferase [Candidatus Latescibacterota bacterium]
MEWYEVAFDRVYPILYAHRDVGEATRVIENFGYLFADKSPVLDLASGNGRYLEALRRKGFESFGLDLSHYLLRSSVEEWEHTGLLVQGDMRHLPFTDRSLGAVINMFTSFGYFSIDTDNLLVFKEIQRVLEPGGVFLFDFLNAEKISKNLLEETRRVSGDFEIHERRRVGTRGKHLHKHASISNPQTGQKKEIRERLRLYTKEELIIMFRSVGLSIEEIYGDYEKNAFVNGVSERVIIVARNNV